MPFPAILALEDGSIFYGDGYGEEKIEVGEIVFNTSMTGYQEIITDPSYKKQIITFTHPHIGNTGINNDDNESTQIHASGIVINEFCEKPSNWRSTKTLEEFLIEQKVIAISGINTRKLTSLLRDKGSMNSCIASLSQITEEEAVKKAQDFSGLKGLDLAKVVSVNKDYTWNQGVWPEHNTSSSNLSIVAYDFGIKTNILRLLSDHVGVVHVVNAETSFEEILELSPNGIFLSNGPGDPSATEKKCKGLLQAILSFKIPVFGICIGHQLIGLSFGAKTSKMSQGHRGANHPVKNLSNNKVEITSQNHGYMIDKDTLPECLEITHLSLFDGSIEGLRHKSLPIFSVQYHPEASPGPTESSYLFQEFLNLIAVSENAKT